MAELAVASKELYLWDDIFIEIDSRNEFSEDDDGDDIADDIKGCSLGKVLVGSFIFVQLVIESTD